MPPAQARRWRIPARIALPLALVALAGALVVSMKVGLQPVSWREIGDGLVAFAGSDADLVVRHVRLPCTLVGLLAGIGLGLAAGVAQGLTRNPLAGPGTLGINAGAAFAVVVALWLAGAGSLAGYVWFGFAGAAVAAVAAYVVGSVGRGGATPVKLAMAGAAVSATFGSMTSSMVMLDHDLFARYRFWLIGSLGRADLAAVGQALPFVLVGAVVALGMARQLDAIALGDETARTLGARLLGVRAVGMVAVVVLAGTATALAGPIAFVGLVAPHVARGLVGSAHRWVLPLAALLAPALLLYADVVGRLVIAPEEVQVGVMAAVLGGPAFLYLVRVRRVAQL